MEFQRSNVWMSLVDYQTFPDASEITEALQENGFECQLENLKSFPGGAWQSFSLLGPEGSRLDVECFDVADSVDAKMCLQNLVGPVELEPVCEERDQVLEMLQEAKFVVQSIKVISEETSETESAAELASELEFGLHRCLAFPVDPEEGVSMWLLHNDDTIGFANEGDILLRFNSKSYNKWANNEGKLV